MSFFAKHPLQVLTQRSLPILFALALPVATSAAETDPISAFYALAQQVTAEKSARTGNQFADYSLTCYTPVVVTRSGLSRGTRGCFSSMMSSADARAVFASLAWPVLVDTSDALVAQVPREAGDTYTLWFVGHKTADGNVSELTLTNANIN